MKRTGVVWCNRFWLPIYYGFCPDAERWKIEMKRLGAHEPYPSSDGRCTFFEDKEKSVCAIITISETNDGKDPIGIVGLLAHEAVHVWQRAADEMGENNPSHEFEAYTVQHISQELIRAYHETRGGLAPKKWRA